jgi:diacylglycerol kinase (ATP)
MTSAHAPPRMIPCRNRRYRPPDAPMGCPPRTMVNMTRAWLIVLIVVAVALITVVGVALGVRAARKRHYQRIVSSRDDDQVHYAFIINPSKPQAGALRKRIAEFCEGRGLTQIEFIETQLNKDGHACAQEALGHGADVLVAVGGDGTVRTVASAVSGTGRPLGIIPIGTGNLFARNMDIPVDDVEAALAVATSHGSRMVDVGRLAILDRDDEDYAHAFLIIAGIGFDALMIDGTDPQLKKNISWLAYFVSAMGHLFEPKNHGTVILTSEDGSVHTSHDVMFRTFLAGNCGQIPMLSLMPEAISDDGLLDFELIDTTGGIIGWASLFGDVVHQTIVGKAQQSPLSTNSVIDQIQGVAAEVTLKRKAFAQVDGDSLGETRHIRFSVDRQALCVRVPAGTDTSVISPITNVS